MDKVCEIWMKKSGRLVYVEEPSKETFILHLQVIPLHSHIDLKTVEGIDFREFSRLKEEECP